MSSMHTDYDICVIGGGINGAGIARDAAGRGLRTLLAEAGDLAGATSSVSTKLIHGGLRYLEHFEFKLVRESLIEREVLLRLAPHIIRPMDFVLPHAGSVRPVWMIRMGLFLYDHLGGRKILHGSSGVDLRRHAYGDPLKRLIRKGFTYQDCWVEDSRLVVLNAMDARERGADILTYTSCVSMQAAEDGGWRIHLRDNRSGDEFCVTARAVINAAGPWVRTVLEGSEIAEGVHSAPQIRLVKGSHIIVNRLFRGDHAYIFQQPDKRIVFAIPYEDNYTLIGTTDEEFSGDPSGVMCSEQEMEYLCTAVNIFFEDQIAPADVLWTYSGVRPLISDRKKSASRVSRDYRLFMDKSRGAPILSVYGGKITTYRTLAEHAVSDVAAALSVRTRAWSAGAPLPGGRVEAEAFEDFIRAQIAHYHWMPEQVVYRYARTYGARMGKILGHATSTEQLGRAFGCGIYEAEVVYAIYYEFVKTVEDFLWRRTKLGLHVTPQTAERLSAAFPALYEKVRAL